MFGDGVGQLDGEVEGGIEFCEREGSVGGFGADLYIHVSSRSTGEEGWGGVYILYC